MQKVEIKELWKVCTGYLVASFALIQFANIAIPYYEIEQYIGINSDELMRVLFISLPIGLVFVLALTYFLKRKGIISSEDTSENISNKEGSYKQKIAVIPFTNLNKDDQGAFLVDGIVEDLITEFSMIKEIFASL